MQQKAEKMKKGIIVLLGVIVMLSSCGTNAGTGAYVGGQFGHVIGSAIGGIAGGWRGHDMGALIGTVGGVVAGAAIGSAIDNAEQKKYDEYKAAREGYKDYKASRGGYEDYQSARGVMRRESSQHDDSGFDPQGRGDDRIDFMPSGPMLEIRNPRIVETERDGVLTRGEECSVIFEIVNTSSVTAFDVRPLVEDATDNKHVNISPNLRVESIAPYQGIRYTATVLADGRLKDGEIIIRIGIAQGDHEITSQTQEFRVPTAKKRLK